MHVFVLWHVSGWGHHYTDPSHYLSLIWHFFLLKYYFNCTFGFVCYFACIFKNIEMCVKLPTFLKQYGWVWGRREKVVFWNQYRNIHTTSNIINWFNCAKWAVGSFLYQQEKDFWDIIQEGNQRLSDICT